MKGKSVIKLHMDGMMTTARSGTMESRLIGKISNFCEGPAERRILLFLHSMECPNDAGGEEFPGVGMCWMRGDGLSMDTRRIDI